MLPRDTYSGLRVMGRSLLIIATCVGLAAAACAAVDNQPAPGAIAELDEASFKCAVEPTLIRDCSYTACHGNAGFPLRVYSIGKLRVGDMTTLALRTAPLTDAEHHANYLSARAFDYGGVAAEDNLILRKVLPVNDGGYEHKGGAIFTGLDDPRAVKLLNWLSGQSGLCNGGNL